MSKAHENKLFEAHQGYKAQGIWSISVNGKKPWDGRTGRALPDWTTPRDYPREAFDGATGIGALLGKVSRNLVDLDLDCAEASQLAAHYFYPASTAFGRDGKVRHILFETMEPIASKRFTDPVTGEVICEIRSDGAMTVFPPSLHVASGQTIEVIGDEPLMLCCPEWLTRHVQRLVNAVIELRHGSRTPVTPPTPIAPAKRVEPFACGASNIERARKYLATMDPSISGAGGHNALMRAAVAMVRGFSLTQADAFALLASEFNPRCVPAWSTHELERKVNEAFAKSTQPFGFLLEKVAS